jgi:hypothetical protein
MTEEETHHLVRRLQIERDEAYRLLRSAPNVQVHHDDCASWHATTQRNPDDSFVFEPCDCGLDNWQAMVRNLDVPHYSALALLDEVDALRAENERLHKIAHAANSYVSHPIPELMDCLVTALHGYNGK